MQQELRVTLSKTSDEKPLVVLENLQDQGAELSPHQLRSLASALMQAASDSESLDITSNHYLPESRAYSLDSLSAAERRVVMFPDGHQDIAIEQYAHNGHKITVYQNAQLTNGSPTFFVTVGQSVVDAPDAYSIQEAREIGNAKAARRKPGKYSD